jgi:hypothetical protein
MNHNIIIIIIIIIIIMHGSGVKTCPQLLRPFIGLYYQPWAIDGADCGATGAMND